MSLPGGTPPPMMCDMPPHTRPAVCKRCGVAGTPDRPISFKGNCPPCGLQASTDQLHDMHTKTGPIHEKWVRGMLAYAKRLESELAG